MKLVLASGSPYRKSLLETLRVPFECYSPDIDESPYPQESAHELANRLTQEKAQTAARKYQEHLIIASDQTAAINNRLLGKPGTVQQAIKQLTACSGQRVTFFTGLTLLNSKTGQLQSECLPFHVTFRQLTEQQISHYINKEQPLDCAGSFKCEGLGITLFEKLEGDDPNILIGLPLIQLNTMLLNEGVDVLLH